VTLQDDPRGIAEKLQLKGTNFTVIEMNATNYVKDIQPTYMPVKIKNVKIEDESEDSKGVKTYNIKK